MKKALIPVVAVLILLILIFLALRYGSNFFSRFSAAPKKPTNVTLTYWGFWEDDNLIKPLITDYQKQYPNVTINYQKQLTTNYRTRLQTQISAGVGPDVFWIHNTWLPMFSGYLAPAPGNMFSVADYKSQFYPVAADSFIRNSAVYAAPMEVDGLGMFYNEEILKAAGATVPKSWQEFIDAAVRLTVRDINGQIKTAGAAMGLPSNVDHWSDILGLLLLQQPGVDLNNPSSPAAAEVLKFFTSFVTDSKIATWNSSMPTSTQAFAQGRLAFYFAPSWRAHELRQINPNIQFKVAPVPQLYGRQVAWGSFWGEAVSVKSANSEEAWRFVRYLTSKETQQAEYTLVSKVRLFGEPYAQVSLAPSLAADPLVGAFVNQGPYYKSWYLASATSDLGINDEMIKYWEDGVNSVIKGTDPMSALGAISQGTKQVLTKYKASTQGR